MTRGVTHGTAAPTSRFPVVVINTGMNAPAYMHVRLAERLAAAGYLVVCVPTGMFAGRARLAFDSAGLASHVNDLRLVLGHVKRWPQIDSARMAIAAWSVGGVGAAVVAAEEAGVRALVSLDAATAYAYGVDYLARLTAPDWRSRVPYLDLRGSVESQVPRSEAFRARRCGTAAISAVVNGIAHRHFVSIWGSLWPQAQDPVVLNGIDAMEQLVLRFLSAALRGEDYSGLSRETSSGGPGDVTLASALPCPS